MDLLILQVMRHREQFEQLSKSISLDILEEPTRKILTEYQEYFSANKSAQEYPIESLKTIMFNGRLKNKSPDERALYNKRLNLIGQLPDPEESALLATKLVELTFATRVGNAIKQYNDGGEIAIIETVGHYYKEADRAVNVDSGQDLHIKDSIEEIIDDAQNSEGFSFELQALRRSIRPLRASDFVVLAGRPDSGKTSFLASQLPSLYKSGGTYGRPIIWFNNEGVGKRIIRRLYQSALGATDKDLTGLSRTGNLSDKFRDAYGGINPIRVIDCHDWDIRDCEKAIAHYNPCLVIFDMLDNLTYKAAPRHYRTDQTLEAMYQWARVIGVKGDFPVIATSQISAKAEEQVHTQCYPPMHMLKDCQTGKQGAADAIIMLGRSPAEDSQHFRFLSAPKNKLATGEHDLHDKVIFTKPIGAFRDA